MPAPQAVTAPVYLDPSKPIEQRIADLIGRLTLEEKAAQLNHLNTGIPRLNIPMWGGWNQTLHGVWSKQPTTLFPAPSRMGATWDPSSSTPSPMPCPTKRARFTTQGRRPALKHGLVYRSPVINISRDPAGAASRRSSAKIPSSPGAWPSPT